MNVLLTGVTRGMGFSIAKTLSNEIDILLGTSKFRSDDDPYLMEIRDIVKDFYYFPQDLSRGRDAAIAISSWARSHVDKIDALILNAGFFTEGDLIDFDESDMRQNLEVNFLINYFIVQELVDLIRASQRKRIVIIGSTAAYEPYPLVPSYGVAKWALRGLAINLRAELASERIGVSFVSPGATWTNMWEGEDLPRNRILEPTDIAKAVAYILTTSEQAVVEELIVRPMEGDIHE